MRRIFAVVAILGVSIGSAVACNFIVQGETGDYGSRCQWDGRNTACGQCIAKSCEALVDKACVPPELNVFDHVQQCAKDPSVGSSHYDYACDTFATIEGGTYPGTDQAALEQNMRVCVRDNCLQGDTPPCRTCPVEYVDPQSSQKFPLEDSGCGACLEAHCLAGIIACCGNDAVKTNVAACAFTKTRLPACDALLQYDGGKADAASYDDYGRCMDRLGTCARESCGNCR